MKITDSVHLVGSAEYGITGSGCNVYAIATDDALALIDVGDSTDEAVAQLLTSMRRDGLDPQRLSHVLLTHVHRDHAGAYSRLRQAAAAGDAGEFTAYASSAEAQLLHEGSHEELGLDFFGEGDRASFPPATVDRTLADGEELNVGGLTLRAIEVPGHSPGCLTYVVAVDGLRMMFSGDVIFHGGYIGVGNWPGSSSVDYRQSLPKLRNLDIDALLPGHGVFTLRGGQQHIDLALADFDGLWPPPNMMGRR